MKESYNYNTLKVGDRVTPNTTSKIDGHPLENDPKYNPWGMGGTIKQIWNPKMPELPYIVEWDTGYTNSYSKENLIKI